MFLWKMVSINKADYIILKKKFHWARKTIFKAMATGKEGYYVLNLS